MRRLCSPAILPVRFDFFRDRLPFDLPFDFFCRPENAVALSDKRAATRVKFERGVAAWMMAIDGTWRRECMMGDVSKTGARLKVGGSIEGINIKEFFLLLSATGLAYRRCNLAWVNGDEIGVTFLGPGPKKKTKTKARE
jgi:hypothetical protein